MLTELSVQYLLASTVVDEKVGGVGRGALDDILEGRLGDGLTEALGALAQAQEVSGETGNVGRSH